VSRGEESPVNGVISALPPVSARFDLVRSNHGDRRGQLGRLFPLDSIPLNLKINVYAKVMMSCLWNMEYIYSMGPILFLDPIEFHCVDKKRLFCVEIKSHTGLEQHMGE